MFDFISVLYHQGKQYIPDIAKVDLTGSFRGRPVVLSKEGDEALCNLCPTQAITAFPLQIDLGKCLFCGECAYARPDLIQFTGDYFLSTNNRNSLIIKEETTDISIDPEKIRFEIQKLYKRSLRLRQVSAGGDNSAEWELNACSNVNFDMGRFGIEFVASPRHADGMVITGPVTQNMAEAVIKTWEAISSPKILILAGTDAISGGIFETSPAVDRSYLNSLPVDLYVPGNPPHPLTFINGVLDLLGIPRKNRS